MMNAARRLFEKLHSRALHHAAFALALGWMLWVVALAFGGKKLAFDIDPRDVRHDRGCAYVLAMPSGAEPNVFLRYTHDTMEDGSASKLVLSENGVSLNRPHASIGAIRKQAGGRYSHRDGKLYFSTPDCSDPRSNGRHYSVSAEPDLRNRIRVSFFAALLLTVFIPLRVFGERLRHWLPAGRDALIWLLTPRPLDSAPVWQPLVMALLVWLGAVAFLITAWSTGHFMYFSTGSAYQFSDTSGYWMCAMDILDGLRPAYQQFREWCQRRVIYPAFLSTIAWLSQEDIHQTLLVQAALLSLLLTIFAKRVASLAGLLGAGLALVLLFSIATMDAFAFTSTENAGLMFGALSMSILLLACQRESMLWVCVGLGLLSIALGARAGAFFVLPFLFIWAGAVAKLWHKPLMRCVLAAGATLATGFLLQALIVMLHGGEGAHSFGNFSYSLYGLSVGGMGWTQVRLDHPELLKLGSDSAMAHEIYRLAFANIAGNPGRFIQGLYKGWHLFVVDGTLGYQRFGKLATWLKTFWWLGGLFFILRWREPRYLLLLAFACGGMLSAPFLKMDGGPRVFAATVSADVLQTVCGTWCLAMLLLLGMRKFWQLCQQTAAEGRAMADSGRRNYAVEAGAISLLASMLMFAFLPTSSTDEPFRREARACTGDDYEVITTIGKNGSYLLDMVEHENPNIFRGEVQRQDFINSIPKGLRWWTPSPPDSIRSVAKIFPTEVVSGQKEYLAWDIYSEENMAEYYGKKVVLCLSRQETIPIFGTPYRKLNSIREF